MKTVNFSKRKFRSRNPFYVKIKLLCALFMFMHIISFQSFAQDDVTNTYLTNAGFDINCNYLTGGTDTVATADPGNTHDVSGWTIASTPVWSAAATFEYGWDGDFNGSSIPSVGSDGASGSGEGALGISVGWSGQVAYTQQVTLPAGSYSIEFAANFLVANDMLANLIGWVPSTGSSVLSDLNSVASLDSWNTGTVNFRTYTQTTGNIQVGMQAINAGSGSNPRLFIDYVKLISYPVTKTELQALVDSANIMLANPQNVPDGSTAYADLSTAVSDAQTVINNGSATVNDIFSAEDNMKLNIEAVHDDILAYGLTPIDNLTASYSTYTNQDVSLTGIGQLTLTDDTNPLSGSVVNLASDDTWIYFSNMDPSEVISTQLSNIIVKLDQAVLGENVRVTQYLYGTMVIPHSSSYKAVTVYDGSNLSGNSMGIAINQPYKTAELNGMNDNIESFILKKGYMATFASNENGTGISRVFIADKGDLTVKTMPNGLSNTTSFVVVRPWRWTTKKGWRGSSSGAEIFNAKSHYDYNNAAYSTSNVEYVPMRHNPGWNAYGNFIDKYESTHALYYNEPDNSVDDGYSTVADAIANYPNMLSSGLRLGSPACTDGGLGWLYDFMDQCDALDYRVDFVAWHFYRAGYSASSLYNTLKAVHDRTGRPIWITEFNNGCNWTYDGNVPSIEENGVIIQSFIDMMDTAQFIERYYVWDGCNEDLRMTNSSTGELYPAGIAYRDQMSPMAFTDDYYNGNTYEGTIIQENSVGFCGVDGTIDNSYTGYTGSGAANTDNAIGMGIDYYVYFTSTGAKTINLRYATTNDRPANIIVNGSVVASNVIYTSTGGFDKFVEFPVSFYAEEGAANIRIEATTSNGLANIDYAQIIGGVPQACDSESYPLILSATSEQAGNPASNILDGNDTDDSRWSADGFPQTVIIDYGENKSITGTRLSTYLDRAYQFTIELDEDPGFSSPYIVDRSSNTDASQPISDDFAAVSARYAKITVTGAAVYTGTWVSLTEFEIVEGTSNIPPTVSITYPSNGANITTGSDITITADASDSDGSISQIEFFVDGSSLGIDNSNPYEMDWTINTGTYNITAVATDNSSATTTSIAITVNGVTIPVTSVSILPTTASINVGATVQLTETVSPSNATNKSISWSSNNTSIATVNSSGLVTGESNGSAVITATTVDGGFTATCIVTVSEVVVPTFNLTTTVSGQGSVSPSSGTYDESTLVSLTATPASGWLFEGWGGDASGTTNPLSITMDADKSITANFSEITGTISTITIQENEDGFCSVDGSIDNNHAGYTGTGFANTDNQDDNGITWSVNVPTAGIYSLVFRMANGSSTNRTAEVLVDGSVEVSIVNFPSTSDWASYSTTSSVDASLPAGTCLIRLQATQSSGLANIDYIEITGIDPSPVACSGLKKAGLSNDISNKNNEVNVFPNPVTQKLNIILPKNFSNKSEVTVIDLIGQVVFYESYENNQLLQVNLSGINEGVYFVVISNGTDMITHKIIKE